jgi:hypothetical protein
VNSSFKRNASAQPCDERAVINPELLCSRGGWHLFSADYNPARRAFVYMLNAPWNPAAIVWRVITGRVDSVQCVAARAWSHISPKRREVLSPPFAHHDSATAIKPIFGVLWMMAAVFCAAPSAIFAAMAASMTKRFQQASTRQFFASAQVNGACDMRCSAVALTQPERAMRVAAVACFDNKSAESLVGQIVNGFHRGDFSTSQRGVE